MPFNSLEQHCWVHVQLAIAYFTYTLGEMHYMTMAVVKRVDLLMWVSVILIDHLIAAIPIYNFCMETDNDIIFHSPLQINAEYEYEIYHGQFLDCLLYQSGEFVGEQCMKSGQMDRFEVTSSNTKDELKVTLTIRDVQKDDAGHYILLFAEDKDDEWQQDVIRDVYINMIIPPGPAECEVLPSSHSPDWSEVHCNASLEMDSDPQGSIVCFQNGKEAPIFREPEHSVNQIQAVFWMDIQSSAKCCSFTPQCEKPPDLCLDFTYSTVTSTFDMDDSQKGEATTFEQSVTSLPTLKYAKSFGTNGQGSSKAVMALTFLSVSFAVCLRAAIVFIIRKRWVRAGQICAVSLGNYVTVRRGIQQDNAV